MPAQTKILATIPVEHSLVLRISKLPAVLGVEYIELRHFEYIEAEGWRPFDDGVRVHTTDLPRVIEELQRAAGFVLAQPLGPGFGQEAFDV